MIQRHAYKIAYLGIGILLIALMTMFARSKINTKPSLDFNFPSLTGSDFSEINMTDLYTDSFIALAKNAYGGLLETSQDNGILRLKLSHPNALGSDLYNNNEKLLKYEMKDFGFEIKQEANAGSTSAQFVINKGNFVAVPNDVLMPMMYKAYNK